ncbi:capsular polysaccharide export protein [Xaviernesmea oryzae]|uniref:Capsular polysaccharide export protein n=2 Tax=Xaviernesmea oryzae TaxID=464029 RepID=A0A1X7FSQ0_9HYPH|nr:capsular polysaccharide export protein [Xaviernesmea oryzae]
MPSIDRFISLLRQSPLWAASSLTSRNLSGEGKPPLFLFGFSRWKTFIQDWFPDRDIIFVPLKMQRIEFALYWRWRILSDRRSQVLAWQYKGPPELKHFCDRYKIPFHYVEDGFIRSLKLGALHAPPMSLAFDSRDMYFNAKVPTDLENLLSNYDFEADHIVMHRAQKAIERLLETGLSKYNSGVSLNVNEIYGPKKAKRILVIGQVERDASIAYGCQERYTNNDLVRLARRENPNADIIYKPHPEVLNGIAPATSNPNEVRDIARILEQDLSLADSLQTIDHVYTITSLAGFEALLRGIKVTTLGCPFYSGWGLTDDRQPNPRRQRKLTIQQLFAGSYVLYPKYFDPESKEYIQIEQAIALLSGIRDRYQKINMDSIS